MSASALRSDMRSDMGHAGSAPAASVPGVPAFVRAKGGVRVAFGTAGERTQALTVAESGGYRIRFPRNADTCEGTLINTGGGMTGGDHMRVDVTLAPGARALVTSQAAEKLYRAEDAPTRIDIALSLGAGSDLAWLPQEMILFDRARLVRRLDVDMAPDAALTLSESVVFGRTAMGEEVVEGRLDDRWSIRRGGRLVFAEAVRLDGGIAARLAHPAIGGGARALATILHVAPDAEARLDAMRTALAGATAECGASAWNGLLVARLMGPDPAALRADLVRTIEAFRGRNVPRYW